MADEARRSLRSGKICIIKNRATGATALALVVESPPADCDDQITVERILAFPAAAARPEERGPRGFGVCRLSLQRPALARHRDHRPLPPSECRLFANHRHALHLRSHLFPYP